MPVTNRRGRRRESDGARRRAPARGATRLLEVQARVARVYRLQETRGGVAPAGEGLEKPGGRWGF